MPRKSNRKRKSSASKKRAVPKPAPPVPAATPPIDQIERIVSCVTTTTAMPPTPPTSESSLSSPTSPPSPTAPAQELFRIRWKNCEAADDSWRTRDQLQGRQELLDEFLARGADATKSVRFQEMVLLKRTNAAGNSVTEQVALKGPDAELA